METSKFKTNVGRDGTIELPMHILEKVGEFTECEVVIRPFRNEKIGVGSVDEAIQDIENSMNQKYPRLKSRILPQMKQIVGISKDMKGKYSQYTDKGIIGMARMEKYLEKGEILENLY